MTIAEKIRMYQEKKAFIDNISKAFEAKPWGSDVKCIEYEVYRKDIDEEQAFFVEFLIVTFSSGNKTVRVASGNSNIANFQVLGNMVDGDYFEDIRDYQGILDRGFVKVQFAINTMLDRCLAKPMSHISDVRMCFNYCTNMDDVSRVLDLIPAVFGSFTAYVNEEEGTFVIVNDWWEDNEPQQSSEEYEFYEGV